MTTELSEQYVEQLENTLELFQERIAELEFAQEDKEWVRFGGEDNYEFSRDYLRKIVARSRLYFLSNPLIHRAVSLQADYVFAQGINIQATDDDVNKVIQDFLDDPTNIKEFTGHMGRLMKEQTLMVDGNVFLVLFTDTVTGKVKIRSILVDEIEDIICNPDDQNEVWFYRRVWYSKNLDGTTERKSVYYPDINYKPSNREKTGTIKGIQIMWNAPVYHVNVGALAKSKFGVPETYSALDWAQAFKRFLEDWATIVRAYARFAFKLTVPGNKSSLVSAKRKLGTTVGLETGSVIETNPAPVTASIFSAAKDGVDITPIKTSGATTSARDGRELRMMVAAALGIPDTFFGDVDVGNLATARTLDRPTELKYRSRQQMWIDIHRDILEYVIRCAMIAPKGELNKRATYTINKDGTLDVRTNLDMHLEVTFPPILEHSITDRIDAVTNAVTLNGKQFAIDSPELAKTTMRLMFQALGLKDVDELLDKIFAGEPEPTTKTERMSS